MTAAVLAPKKERISWALYDFANTVFSMNIATLYFAVWIVSDLGAPSTMVAVGNGVASALVALSIPLFGAISDATGRRKPWVIGFTIAACVATAAIGVIGYNTASIPAILIAFIIANYSYQGALPFYNAMLPDLAPPSHWGRLSGLGTALGYVGSIAGVLLITPFFTGAMPVLGAIPTDLMNWLRSVIPFTEQAGRVSTFVPTALLFLLMSLPLFLVCKDRNPIKGKATIKFRQAFTDLKQTFKDARKYPGAFRFIIASFLYQDAMGTIITFMALYAVVAMGFQQGSETTLFVVLTVPAVIGSYLIGFLVDKIGPKKSLITTICIWIALLIAMILAPSRSAFWVVGFGIGLIYGGIAVAERPMLLSLVPESEAGRFFGLMVLSARAAAIVGPFVWGFAVDGLTPQFGTGFAYRAAVGTVAVAMVIALFLLRGVSDKPFAETQQA
jgi:UMF1 family MFS transporter